MEEDKRLEIITFILGLILVGLFAILLITILNDLSPEYKSFCESKGGNYNFGNCYIKTDNNIVTVYKVEEINGEITLVRK